jgi:outer membrane protein assembly factor BamB
MEYPNYNITDPCDCEESDLSGNYFCGCKPAISQLNGQAFGRCKLPNSSNPLYVPIYVPKNTCPDPVNIDPRRNETYCKPNPSLSVPLSNEEYMRKKLLNGGRALSNSKLLQTSSTTGKYRTTLWNYAGGTSDQPSDSDAKNLRLPFPPTAPPVTGTMGTAVDSSTLTFTRMAAAARGTLSALDGNGKRFDSFATLRRMGKAIISNPGGFGGFNEPCISCDLSGTSASVIVGQFKCTCEGPEYYDVKGQFGLLWGQLSYGGSFATPALSPDGRLLYVGANSYVYGIDTTTGNFIWSFQNPVNNDDNFSLSNISVGSNGTIYFGGGERPYFFAVDGLRGTLIAQYTTGNADNYFIGKAAFSADGSIVYATSRGPNASVYAFNLSCVPLFSYSNASLLNNFTLQSPCVGPDGTVYISYSGKLVALNESLLSVKWIADCGFTDSVFNADWYSPRVDSNGLIYVGSSIESSRLYCFIDNGSSATLKWSYLASLPSIVLSPVFGARGEVYIAANTENTSLPQGINNAGSVISIRSSNGTARWTYRYLGTGPNDNYNWVFPAVGTKGRIYITNLVDSSLVIIKDIGNNFQNYKEVFNSDADAIVYGSSSLSPPLVGENGKVFWCNGNQNLPSIFAAGYPIIKNHASQIEAPVFIPQVRSVLPAYRINPSAQKGLFKLFKE